MLNHRPTASPFTSNLLRPSVARLMKMRRQALLGVFYHYAHILALRFYHKTNALLANPSYKPGADKLALT